MLSSALSISGLTRANYRFHGFLAGWGIGLAFHGVFSRRSFILDKLREKEALVELIARERRREKAEAGR